MKEAKEMEFRFDYLKCQNCENKDLCDRCESCLTEKMLLEQEIQYVNLKMSGKTLAITSELDLPKLEELLRKYEMIVH